MITTLQLQNFKSYQSARLYLGRLTVLMGANASGKSNAIEALRLLSRLATGERLGLIGNPQYQSIPLVRGQVEHLGYQGKRCFELSCTTTHPDWPNFSIQLTLGSDNQLLVTQEMMTSSTSTSPLYEITSPPQGAGRDIVVTYNTFSPDPKKASTVCSSYMAVFTQLLSDIRFPLEQAKSREIIPQVAEQYVHWLSRIVFLEPKPSLMRGYGHITDTVLQENGQNLSGVLYHLCESLDNKEAVLEFIRNLPEQDIQEITFLETPWGDVLLQLTETFGGRATPYDATRISDGTLRVLAIAAVLLSAPKDSVVVIEEIDNGIHPSRVKGLLEKMADLARQRNLRILMSSHNPALLDALPQEAIPNTEFCYRSPNEGSSQLIRLQDIPDYPELMTQGSLGHLMTGGRLERFVKEYPGADRKKQNALAWLACLNEMVESQ
jgi:energy-coupling factor transporter ATP-binding protein EcfA2